MQSLVMHMHIIPFNATVNENKFIVLDCNFPIATEYYKVKYDNELFVDTMQQHTQCNNYAIKF